MGKLKVLLRGSAFRSIDALVAICIGFLTLPFLNKYLGNELYGMWVLISSVTGLMYLFDMGFASAVIQKISSYINTRNYPKVNSVISTALCIYSILGLIIAIVTVGIACFYHPDLKGLVTSTNFKIIILLSGLAIAFEFPCKAFAGLVAAHHRFDLIATYSMVFKVLSATALMLSLWLGYKILMVAILSFVFSILSSLAFVYVAYYVYRDMKISAKLITADMFHELFGFSAWAFLIDVNNIVKNRIDVFCIGAFVSLSAVATYYASVRLVDYTLQLLYKMLGITLPTLTGHAAAGDNDKFREDLLLINRINTYAFAFAFIFYVYAGKSILYYWLGNNFDYQTGYIVLAILAFGRISGLAVDGYITSLYAKSKHRIMTVTGFFETIFTALMLFVTLSVLKMGVVFAALSIAVPLVISKLVLLPLLSKKQLDLAHYGALMAMSFRPLILLVPCLALLFITNPLLPVLTWGRIVVGILLAVIVVVFMIFEIQSREKALIAQITMVLLGSVNRLYARGNQ